MPTRHIALFRGINVGKAKRVAMADLRALMEKRGFKNVRTLLNSGNVVFTADGRREEEIARVIEEAVAGELGVKSRTTVITAGALKAIVDTNPLLGLANDPSRLLVGVLHPEADVSKLATIAEKDWAPEAFAAGPGAGYLWCAGGVLDSPLGKAFGRAFGDLATTRNWATMTKLLDLAEAP
jgi:uncharacterized protein (DUF1697 family)